jgi:hypothetical protein
MFMSDVNGAVSDFVMWLAGGGCCGEMRPEGGKGWDA